MAKKKQTNAPTSSHIEQKKGFGYYFKRIFIDSCIYYTIMVLLFMFIDTILVKGNGEYGINSKDFLGLYPFAFLIGCANLLFGNKKIKLWLRITLHATFVIGGFVLYLLTIKGNNLSSITAISGLLVIIYIMVMATVVTVLALKAKKERENDPEYKKMYENITENRTRKKTSDSSISDLEKEVFSASEETDKDE